MCKYDLIGMPSAGTTRPGPLIWVGSQRAIKIVNVVGRVWRGDTRTNLHPRDCLPPGVRAEGTMARRRGGPLSWRNGDKKCRSLCESGFFNLEVNKIAAMEFFCTKSPSPNPLENGEM